MTMRGPPTEVTRFFKTLAAVVESQHRPGGRIHRDQRPPLKGSYTGIGEEVHYFFEWGPTASYGMRQCWNHAGSGSGHQGLSAPLSGLLINRAIPLPRCRQTTHAGTTFGADRIFTTLGATNSRPTSAPPARRRPARQPEDVAVDDSDGDIYVADSGNHRSSNSTLRAASWRPGVGVSATAAPLSQVCTSGCQAGIPGFGAGQLHETEYIEVDNSGGPSAGDVYVADEADGRRSEVRPLRQPVCAGGTAGRSTAAMTARSAGSPSDTAGDLFMVTDEHALLLDARSSQDGALNRVPNHRDPKAAASTTSALPAAAGSRSARAALSMRPNGSRQRSGLHQP